MKYLEEFLFSERNSKRKWKLERFYGHIDLVFFHHFKIRPFLLSCIIHLCICDLIWYKIKNQLGILYSSLYVIYIVRSKYSTNILWIFFTDCPSFFFFLYITKNNKNQKRENEFLLDFLFAQYSLPRIHFFSFCCLVVSE